MNELTAGKYIIECVSGLLISRSPTDDVSPTPKKIVSLVPMTRGPTWDILPVGNGKYDMLVGGARVGPMERDQNRIYAFIVLQGPSRPWKIAPVHPGAREFYITLDDTPSGWTLESERPDSTLALQPIDTNPPPKPTQQFRFIPVSE